MLLILGARVVQAPVVVGGDQISKLKSEGVEYGGFEDEEIRVEDGPLWIVLGTLSCPALLDPKFGQ